MIYKIEILEESAKFKFLPRLNRPDLRGLYRTCKSAEELLSNENTNISKAILYKIGRVALTIVRLLADVESFLSLPLWISIIGIPIYLMVRFFEYAAELGEDIIAQRYTDKLIDELNRLKQSTNDSKKKQEINKQIAKLNRKLQKFENN